MADKSAERHLVVEFNCPPQNAAAVKEQLLRFIGPARLEDGCLYYDLYQGVEHPTKFFILDGWRDQAAVDAHGQSSNVVSVLKDLVPLLSGSPTIIANHRLSDPN